MRVKAGCQENRDSSQLPCDGTLESQNTHRKLVTDREPGARGTVSCARPPGQLLTDRGCASILLTLSVALFMAPILLSGKCNRNDASGEGLVCCVCGLAVGPAEEHSRVTPVSHCRDLNLLGEWTQLGSLSCCWSSEVKGSVVPESLRHTRGHTHPSPASARDTNRQTDM